MLRRCSLAIAVLMVLAPVQALATDTVIEETSPSRDDWGGVGLMQTPTARMAPEGEIAFTASNVSPYSRYTFALQPFEWLEATYRYSNVVGKRYGPEHFSGDQNFKDKSIDVKVRLWEESRWMPEIAAGMRDIGGTGLFSSEYLVASKRFGNFDFSLGVATGYMGNRGDFENPLKAIDDRFAERPVPTASVVNAGKMGFKSIFRGPVGVFGGVAYQKPGEKWQIKLELDGNDYHQEPAPLVLTQDSPINLGFDYALNDNVQLKLGWERGNTLMGAVTIHGRAGKARPATVLPHFQPNPERLALVEEARQALPANEIPDAGYWQSLVGQAQRESRAGILALEQRGNDVMVEVEGTRFQADPTTFGRLARVLDAGLPEDVEWITMRRTAFGLDLAEISVRRSAVSDYLDGLSSLGELAPQIEITEPVMVPAVTHYRTVPGRFYGRPSLQYGQVIGGGEGAILFELGVSYDAVYRLGMSSWWRGRVDTSLFGTYDHYRFSGLSNLPRVRTHQREYATTSDIRLPNFEFHKVAQIGRATYASVYGGLLENMFGGVGAEVLHRPIGERWAIGGNLNWVKQRDFHQDFRFRDYDVVTGHVDFHYRLGSEHRVDATLSAGRYLAGDWGLTANLARRFDNGVVMGAWASKTNVSSREFGEGSFDKGIYFSIPFSFLSPVPSRSRAGFSWRPIQRDGAAMLNRSYPLYSLTEPRDAEMFFVNLEELDR